MTEVLKNKGTINYSSQCEDLEVTSNTVVTRLVERFKLCASKQSLSCGFRPDGLISYVVRVENVGEGALLNPQIVDYLGDNNYLTFEPNSLEVYLNGQNIDAQLRIENYCLVVLVCTQFKSGDLLEVFYQARVDRDIPNSVETITNKVRAFACTDFSPSRLIEAATVSVSVNRDRYALLEVVKEANRCDVGLAEELVYTFTLKNIGNIEATRIVLEDCLPKRFCVQRITLVTPSLTHTFKSHEYHLCSKTNTLTLPSDCGFEIVVLPNETVRIEICGIIR